MCRNLIFASLNEKGNRIPEYVLESLVESVRFNDDGFSIFAVTENGVVYERTLSLYKYLRILFSIADEKVSFLHTHQRAATVGAVNVDNVHLWKYNDILFSHNGTVYNYAEPYYILYSQPFAQPFKYSKDMDSDSKKFFENNAQKIEKFFKTGRISAIEKLCNEEGLWGVIMLNDMRGRFTALGVGKPVYLYLSDTYAVVSNTAVNVSGKGIKAIECKMVRGAVGSKVFYRKYRCTKVTVENHQPTDWYLEYF